MPDYLLHYNLPDSLKYYVNEIPCIVSHYGRVQFTGSVSYTISGTAMDEEGFDGVSWLKDTMCIFNMIIWYQKRNSLMFSLAFGFVVTWMEALML